MCIYNLVRVTYSHVYITKHNVILSMNHKTTILLDVRTREDLRSIGRKGQSYDNLIQELIFLSQIATSKKSNKKRVAQLAAEQTQTKGGINIEQYGQQTKKYF